MKVTNVANLIVRLTNHEYLLIEQGQGAMAEISLMCRIRCTMDEAKGHVSAWIEARTKDREYLGGIRI